MEEMSRMKRKKQQLTNIHDDVEENLEEEVHPSDDSHFPTREDFHEYKKQRTKKVRNPLFTTLAIIFPIIVIGVFFLLIYYTSEEIKHNNNQDVYIDKTSSADTDPVPSALVETKNDSSADKADASAEEKKKKEAEKEKQRSKEKAEQKKKEQAAKEKAEREKAAAAKKREQQQLALQKQQEEKKRKEAEEKKKQEKKPVRVIQHTVGPEENLYRISMKYYQNRSGEEKIKAYNHLKGNSVYSGQVLNIPLEN
ncbi:MULTISPECIES: LysM peptidoglycan-binding domain-containing protein [Bacillus]|uniref:LysM peptidoglycan-binding domain-containing protein n=1 Tax=Bacillus TaxID=1386 RepID=UPI001E5BEE4D|nr:MULTISPECIES: LysM peptidoglycan-binding domain-containing protein [Bacillus]MCC9087617.1 LysM peptidoglycan-binding domain-containing protein [Bacillus pumilus]MED1747929.1 LysM peptidoglycan-binding domain-containing protein [Bacillus zhangzhouensis]